METRRCDAGAGLVSAASTAIGLADVVRCSRIVSSKSVVCADGDRVIAWETASRRAFRAKSVFASAAPIRPRDILSVLVHDDRGTSTNRRVVETAGAWRISAKRLARRRAVRS